MFLQFLRVPKKYGRNSAFRHSSFISAMALFVALGIVLNIFSIQLVGFGGRASFVYGFLYLSGILFGPIYGFAVGAISDILGHIIAPQGAYIWQITVSNGLVAAITGLIFAIRIKGKWQKDVLVFAYTLVWVAVILCAFYFKEYIAPNSVINPKYTDYLEWVASGKEWSGAIPSEYLASAGLHNSARIIIIALASSFLFFGLYKIVPLEIAESKPAMENNHLHEGEPNSMATANEQGQEAFGSINWLTRLIFSAVVAFIPTTLGLTSWGLMTVFGGYAKTILAYSVWQIIWVGINLFILYLLIPALNRSVFRQYPIGSVPQGEKND